MASKLEESTHTAKKLLIGCGILILISLIVILGSKLFKKKEPPFYPFEKSPRAEFGPLPELTFESLELKNLENINYKIDTVDGKLKNFPQIVNVYKTALPRQSFTAYDDALKLASKYNFTGEPQQLTNTLLKWTKDFQVLTIDKLYWTVSITTDYKSDPSVFKANDISPDNEPYISAAKNFLGFGNLLPEEYLKGEAKVTLLKLNKDFKFQLASSASEADFVRVDFFKKNEIISVNFPSDATEEVKKEIEKYREYAKLYLDNPNEGTIYVIMGGKDGVEKLYELQYTNWQLEARSTYLAISTDKAWENVKNGKGYLRAVYDANESPFESNLNLEIEAFHITNVELAYYTSRQYHNFLIPFYKFSGAAPIKGTNRNAIFVIYYPAIESN